MPYQDKKSEFSDSVSIVTKDSAILNDDAAMLHARAEMYQKGKEESQHTREQFVNGMSGLGAAVLGVAVVLVAKKYIINPFGHRPRHN